MKILNTNAQPKGGADALRAALDAYLKSATNKDAPTFAEIRAAVPALASAKDGEIHQAALDAGYKVVL